VKVRRSSLGGYHVDGKRVPSVTEIIRSTDDGTQFASQNIVLNRMRQFFTDCNSGLFPSSCMATIEDWGGVSIENAAKWLGTDEGQRWLAAGWTKATNGYMDRGTILHLFKDELSVNPVWRDKEISDWLECEIASEWEKAKMTRAEYKDYSESDPEKLKFKEWHDRYASGQPQRSYDCEFDDVMPYLLSLNRWWQDESPEFFWVERILIGKGFAGTADGLCQWRGRTWLSDFKSRSSSGVRTADSLQLGGYSLADRFYDPEKDEIVNLDWPDMGGVVFTVTPDKVYSYALKDLKAAQSLFRSELKKQGAESPFYTYHQTNAMTQEKAAV